MIDIDNKIVHRDIFEKCFCCNIAKCRGICCVEGDAGAPLEPEEEAKIKEILPFVYDRLLDEAKVVVSKIGVSMVDIEGDLTAAICGERGACVFVQYTEDRIVYCVLEKAYEEGLIDFRKPISCHLYPIRVKKYSDFDALNYDVWSICRDAVVLGNEKHLRIYEFLKEPLIKKYGEEWYKEACIAADYLDGLDD